ncbi:hypothetical protein Y032_0024g986 [Ancylostoma ceylanicum]|nr:hypothetical protein Y032_0024g986 [Ancylostoma ceylanicum]
MIVSLLFFTPLLISVVGLDQYYSRDGIPRFKTFERLNHEVFLGDKVKLTCLAMSKSPLEVKWYRNGELLNKEAFGHRFRENKKHMTLDIKAVEVSDQGLWTCKVSNHLGKVDRNFTVEIIDFCDYFAMRSGAAFALPPASIPMECICLWQITNDKERHDIDYSIATTTTCNKYASRIEKRARKSRKELACLDPPCDMFGIPLGTTTSTSTTTASTSVTTRLATVPTTRSVTVRPAAHVHATLVKGTTHR